MILLSSLAVLALTSCASPDQRSADAAAGSSSCMRLLPLLFGQGVATNCPFVRDTSYANPTGEVTRGQDGAISLYTAHAGGSG